MQIDFYVLKQMQSLNLHPEAHFRLYGRHLENSIWRHNSAVDRPITTKFGRQMPNDMPMTTHTSKSKQDVQFQYGGRPFSETGSRFISAVDWDISTKFGMPIEFHLLKQTPSLNLNSEVNFRLYSRHLEKSIWRYNSAADRPTIAKSCRQMQNVMPMTTRTSKSKPEVQFQYGGSRTISLWQLSSV